MSRAYKVVADYKGSQNGRAVYMRKAMLEKLLSFPKDILADLLKIILNIRDRPLGCGQDTLPYEYGFNVHVFWEDEFFFLYRCHKPTTGPFSGLEWLVHVIDVDSFKTDEDGNRILKITEDPDFKRTLAERDGEIID
ncbi:hypothetical protein [Azospirillum sp.]|uniref:hypothetical protein n=1 Tax=Azospirillum sp. TaxID=34012 RepID=UPI002620A06F|nr:hypothetical protein [Azospirillum sp.]